jgi:hypothetical protein
MLNLLIKAINTLKIRMVSHHSLLVINILFQVNPNRMEVNEMGIDHPIGRPVEYSGKVLNHRNDLTGPEAGAEIFPKLPNKVSIQERDKNK